MAVFDAGVQSDAIHGPQYSEQSFLVISTKRTRKRKRKKRSYMLAIIIYSVLLHHSNIKREGIKYLRLKFIICGIDTYTISLHCLYYGCAMTEALKPVILILEKLVT